MRRLELDDFMPLVDLAASGCWVWTGRFKRDGYGRFGDGLAHRFIYGAFIGPIPGDREIDHLCRNRACVNPDHLEAVTRAENNRRRDKALGIGQYATHCIHGHDFTPANTYRRTDRNGRCCRACNRRAQAASKVLHRGERPR